MMNMQNLSLFEIMLIILIFILYFLPCFIAALRQHKNAVASLLLNLALGWTGLGWIVSLVWSVIK